MASKPDSAINWDSAPKSFARTFSRCSAREVPMILGTGASWHVLTPMTESVAIHTLGGRTADTSQVPGRSGARNEDLVDRGDDRQVGFQPGHLVQVAVGQPPQVVVVRQGLGYAGFDLREPHPHPVAVQDRPVLAVGPVDLFTQAYVHAEFLADLAVQRRFVTLPLLYLAAGELPPAGQALGCAAARCQQRSRPFEIIHDGRRGDEGG